MLTGSPSDVGIKAHRVKLPKRVKSGSGARKKRRLVAVAARVEAKLNDE